MKNMMKRGMCATALLGAAALLPGTALANSIHEQGYFGGSYRSIGPGNHFQRTYAGRIGPLHEGRYYRDRGYAYGYGPGYYGPYDDDYGSGPDLTIGGPGFGVGFGIY